MSSESDGNEKTSTLLGTFGTTENLSSLPTDQNGEFEFSEKFFFGFELLHKMDLDDLMELRDFFFCEKEARRIALTRNEFIEAFQEIGGGTSLTAAAGKLFDSLDVTSTGRISWSQVLDGIIERMEVNTDGMKNFWHPIDPEVKIYGAIHCKREPITKIVTLETKTAFCYVVVSRLGRVGVYDGEFSLLDSYKLALKPNEETLSTFGREKEEKQRRSQTTWIADVIYISDSNSLLYASSDRVLHLYDANSLSHIPLCRIVGLPNVPTCLEYFASNLISRPSLLFIGDDSGNIITMKFHQVKSSLFKKKHPDKLDVYYWSELSEQSDYVTYSTQMRIHNDAVIQISFSSSNNTIFTCSNDSNSTLVIRHIDGRRKPYIFKITRGIKCFHYERSMHLIATGSNDFVVRLWNEVVTKKPVISLYGHKAPVVDVRIIKYMSSIISLSREGVVKVWDVNDYYCQMTLPIQFPILKVVGARVDFGIRSIYPGPKAIMEMSNEMENSREGSRTTGASANTSDEIEMQISERDYVKRDENQWKRRKIVIACSNFVAFLNLMPLMFDGIENDFPKIEELFLPPPPKEHYASAPSPWKIAESYTKTPDDSEESDSTSKSSGSSSIFPPGARETRSTKCPRRYQNFTGDTIKSPIMNMNAKRTQYVIRQEQMKMLVEQCAPHLALDLHELEPIKFSKPLPVSRNMKERGIDVSDPERVLKAKIQRDPTIGSLNSSSGAQSPRSSKSSKSTTVIRKKFTLPRGRLTPDWLAEKIHSNYPDSTEIIS